MQTQSHFLITLVANQQGKERQIPVQTFAVLLGSVLPDIPFTVLTIGYAFYYRWFAALPANPYNSVMEYLHFDAFFNDPIWLIGHNFFHSLVVNALIITVGIVLWRKQTRWGFFLFWLGVSTQFHTVIDIFTHHSDGPLMFFPLNWHYRFASPVSYWERNAYGGVFMIFEYTLDVILLIYLGWRWYQRRQTKNYSHIQ